MPLKKDLKKLKLTLKELESKPESNWFDKLMKKIKIKNLKTVISKIELKLDKLKIVT
jgi:hypothetical protein